jgi:hypothetical protein
MANVNITEASSSVVLSQRMWSGSDNTSTDWLQSPIGSNAAAGAMHLLVVDVVVTAQSAATTFDLTDTGITGVSGTSVLSVLSVTNQSGGFEAPTLVRSSGSTVAFTSAAGTAGDTHRIVALIYA